MGQVTDGLEIRQPREHDNFYRSATRGQSITTGNLESAAVEHPHPALWGEFSRTRGFSSSKFSFPGAWPRILEIMVITADIPPLQISPPRLRPHRCLDISVPGTICLMRRKGREERGVREGLGQRDHINSQASSQAGDCHFLLEPLDIERVHLMQKGKGRHIKLRDWLAPLCYCYVFTS